MRSDREIWQSLTVDQRFILARLVLTPDAEQWGGDVEVLRALVAMGLADEWLDGNPIGVSDRGREIYEAGR